MIKKFTAVLQEELAYLDTGGEDKETLVLIHGNMSSSMFFLRTIDKLKDRYRIIAPDLPGFGDSTYRKVYTSIKDYSDLLARFFIKLGIRDYTVLGWSMGGGVVYELLLNDLCKEDIKKAIILAGVGLNGFRYKEFLSQLKNGIKHSVGTLGAEEIVMGLKHMNNFYKELKGEDLREEIHLNAVKNSLKKFVYSGKDIDPEELEINACEAEKQVNLKDVAKALYDFDMIKTEAYKKFESEVLILHGTDDFVTSVKGAVEDYKLIATHAYIKLIEGGTHGLMATNFEEYIKALEDYLGGKYESFNVK